MGLLVPAMLVGLVALAIPPVVHLLNRRRFDVVDWAAMRFLVPTDRTRKKIFLEQLLLMLVRMGLLALLVLAAASPFSCVPKWMKSIVPQTSRDVVIVIDGSYSMGYVKDGRSAHDVAKERAVALLGQLQTGDAVAVIVAGQQPSAVVGYLSTDLSRVRGAIQDIPKPRGGTDMSLAIREAMKLLRGGGNSRREVVVLGDGQRHGWSDPRALERWELLGAGLGPDERTRISYLDVVKDRTGQEPNWGLSEIRSGRAVGTVGRDIKFSLEVRASGAGDIKLPEKARIEIDERPAGEIRIPSTAVGGRIPVTFNRKFTTVGSHLVSVILDEDAMAGDNRVDFALETLSSVPVLVIDGDGKAARSRSSDYLRDALAPALDRTPSFLLRVYGHEEFSADMLTRPLDRDRSTVPRVLILCNVSRLTPPLVSAVEEFLQRGGGVLVTCGSRVDAAHYNAELFREGRGWLPGRLIEPVGDENNLERAARIAAAGFDSPPFDLFKNEDPGSIAGSAYFPRWWKMEPRPETGSTTAGLFHNRDSFLVQREFGKGRVVQSAVPFDHSWRTNLTDLGDFVRLNHEIVFYLAAARSSEVNLDAKQALVFRPADGEMPGPVTVHPPDGRRRRLTAKAWPFLYDETHETGVYRINTDTGKQRFYVIRPDEREADLAPMTDDDRRAARRFLKNLEYPTDPSELFRTQDDPESRLEFWWVLLLFVIVLLMIENRMTSRIAGTSAG